MDKADIERSFSKSAPYYDRFADVQKKAALGLLSRLDLKKFEHILEIGCGTANFTLLLKERFQAARLTAVDISSKMVDIAQDKMKDTDARFIVADAENIDLDEKFDLITSNACFQWFEDLDRALDRYKDMLQKEGLLSFSIFGPLTYHELSVSLKSLFDGASVSAEYFIDRKSLEKMLSAHLRDVRVDEVVYEEGFPSLSDLLKKIKYTGTNGAGLQGSVFLGPKKLKEVETVYLDRFKRIKATYQVFFCRGQKI